MQCNAQPCLEQQRLEQCAGHAIVVRSRALSLHLIRAPTAVCRIKGIIRVGLIGRDKIRKAHSCKLAHDLPDAFLRLRLALLGCGSGSQVEKAAASPRRTPSSRAVTVHRCPRSPRGVKARHRCRRPKGIPRIDLKLRRYFVFRCTKQVST